MAYDEKEAERVLLQGRSRVSVEDYLARRRYVEDRRYEEHLAHERWLASIRPMTPAEANQQPRSLVDGKGRSVVFLKALLVDGWAPTTRHGRRRDE